MYAYFHFVCFNDIILRDVVEISQESPIRMNEVDVCVMHKLDIVYGITSNLVRCKKLFARFFYTKLEFRGFQESKIQLIYIP